MADNDDIIIVEENGETPNDDVTIVEEISETPNDDIMIVEENGETPKKKHVTVGFAIENQPAKELCTFQREIITERDYKTLADEEYLNENIINFYLTWLYEKLSDEHKSIIYIYSSYFYSRLKSKTRKKNKDKSVDETKTRAEREYKQVNSWTKKIDVFEKRMLIIPICEESHWYLVIVCNPRDDPFIMVLDSLGQKHPTTVARIKSYLIMEHLEKIKLPSNFDKDRIVENHPLIPHQPNGFDCGPYLLHYVELIFRDPDVYLGSILPDLSKWFNTSDVEYKRENIANLIKELASKDKSRKVEFPKIKMPSREETSNSKDKKIMPKSAKFEKQLSKVNKLEAKITVDSINSFKSDKLKSFDMFASKKTLGASVKSSPEMKKPRLISDVHMADKGASEGLKYQQHLASNAPKAKSLEKSEFRVENTTPQSDKSMFEIKKESDQVGDGGEAYDCTICKVECRTQERFKNHFQGKKHQNMLLTFGYAQTQSQFNCEVCNVKCTGEKQFNVHLAGKKHQKKVSASTLA